ncbi:site-specific DNA-methyltransferase [bacterium]|nr:site-specific DNA-methyltransferase [bacterium]
MARKAHKTKAKKGTIQSAPTNASRRKAKKNSYESYTKEELIAEIKRLRKRKKYGLVWEEKPEDVVEQCKRELPVLEGVDDLEIATDREKPVNIFIEGDNYHALSVLNYTHRGKIDVIYIDPPFNTGARDWKYNNQYVDYNDAWRHSKWLSFMHKRLLLAKRLLSRKGVLICAIDHNEQEALGLLLQEVFSNKETTCVTIVHNPRGIQGKNFSYTHEYAYFVYPGDGEKYIGTRPRPNPSLRNMRDNGGGSRREDARNCFYPFYAKNGRITGTGAVPPDTFHPARQTVKKDDGLYEVWPIDGRGVERKWRYSVSGVARVLPHLRVKERGSSLQIHILKKEDRYRTVWVDSKYDANEYGSKLLGRILEGTEFPFPKSLYNVKECLEAVAGDNQDAIILDYFAGSGTTGHAMLELNKEDGGNRSFILCTNNENDIASDVCYPRIKKVIEGYISPDGKEVEGLGGNLKYFRTAFVSADPTDKNKKQLTLKATELLCLREDTFEPVKSTGKYKIFRNKDHYTGIIFDQLAIPAVKKVIAKLGGRFSVYVFSLGDDAFDEEFEDMRDKVKLSPIPEAILRVYRRIFK